MKIFNWVQRRFSQKDGMAQNANKSGDISSYDKAQLVLENNAFANVLDGWKGGILSIGTFGYDPLMKDIHMIEQKDAQETDKEQVGNESEHQITDSEEEDENPLVYAAYEHDYDYEGLLGLKMEGNGVSFKEDEFEFDEMMMMKNTKKERTTLAELFSADSEELQKKQPISKGEIIKEIKSNYKHAGFSFAKKLIGDQDARPIHKLHRLMRRMLKRKIHPDEVEGVNKHNLLPLNSSKVVTKKCETITEAALLLPTQVADATI